MLDKKVQIILLSVIAVVAVLCGGAYLNDQAKKARLAAWEKEQFSHMANASAPKGTHIPAPWEVKPPTKK